MNISDDALPWVILVGSVVGTGLGALAAIVVAQAVMPARRDILLDVGVALGRGLMVAIPLATVVALLGILL